MSNVLKGTSDINEKKKAIKNDSRSICPTPNPRIRSIITEGILVFFALKSNM